MSTLARLHQAPAAKPAAPPTRLPASAGRLVQAVVGLLARWQRSHDALQAERLLREFDDRMLRDIGLQRLDIRHATRFGRMDETGDERDTPAGRR